jgi:predicted nucleic acid-binding Zn ribbon protein
VDPTQTLVPRLLRDLGLEAGVAGWRAVEAWPEVAGPRIAQRTRAAGFRDGVLHVEVEGSAWAYELEFLKRRLLGELQQRIGRHVRDLRFVTTRGGIRR